MKLIVTAINEICVATAYRNRDREIYKYQVLSDLKEFWLNQK